MLTGMQDPTLHCSVKLVTIFRPVFNRTPDILARFDKVCNVSNERTNLYTLENAGHWVHVDNPDGLMRMLSGFIAENEKR
jgi:pimeloyl-ACP methyl ester carboxylesterase